ncbi:MAG: alpha/beta fold hydrolase [Verrucomicrobiota bacterium]
MTSLPNESTLQRWESPGQPPILALPGFLGDAQDFAWLAQQSLQHLDWWSLDLPGQGNAKHEGIRNGLFLGHFLAAVKRAQREIVEHTQQLPILLGYSMGGRIAIQTALDSPKYWRALVTIGSTPGIESEDDRATRRKADALLAEKIRRQPIEVFLEQWNQLPIIRSQQSIPSDLRIPMQERRRQNIPDAIANMLTALSPGLIPSRWEDLPNLKIPCLFTAGTNDKKFSNIADLMAALAPQSQLAPIRRAGHCAHLEQPHDFLEKLLTFVRGLNSSDND